MFTSSHQNVHLSTPPEKNSNPDTNQSCLEILIVDDNRNNLHVLSLILQRSGYSVRKALSGEMAIKSTQMDPPDLILLDICMPQMSGYEVCQILKNDPQTAEIPIIFISALGEPSDKVKGLEMGSVDYICKPFNANEVLARVKAHLRTRISSRYLKEYALKLQQEVHAASQELSEVSTCLEQKIVENLEFREKYQNLVTHDPSTGALNRLGFLEKIKNSIEKRESITLVLMQYDHLSIIQETGYQINSEQDLLLRERNGLECSASYREEDPLLSQIKTSIQESFELLGEESIAYLGCGQFGLLLPGNGMKEIHRSHLRNFLVQFTKKSICLNQNNISLKWNIGIAFSNATYLSKPDQLLWDAELAMSVNQDGSRINIFTPEIKHQISLNLQIEKDLRVALQSNHLSVFYQPILSLSKKKIVALEALLRWNHTKLGFISPAQFIPIAEKSDLIIELDRWVFKAVCQQFHDLQEAYLQGDNYHHQDLSININFSTRQFEQDDLLSYIDKVMEQYNIQGHHLKVEIIESNLLEQNLRCKQNIAGLKERGIQLSLDDFGTGYSTFSYLQSVPFDSLKIDKSFIQRIDTDRNIVETIIKLCRSYGISVVAEGIEKATQLEELTHLSCDFGQGYFLSHPLSQAEVKALLTRHLATLS
ncbi:MAG: two-component system response regulator [Prochlorotrichaceae cyanobacterium]|jgi:EAL domain-containing protein (putative c-di-GMP-specific phosphodiesterase class I)/DNA-binding response OmpR family regulator